MSLFSPKKKIMLYSEKQKDDYIEKLDHANISYDIQEKTNSINGSIVYVLSMKASDYKKVI